HGKADRLGPEALDLPAVVGVLEDLEIDQADVVAGRADRGRHSLEAEGLESQVYLRVHQGTGMHEEDSHALSLPHGRGHRGAPCLGSMTVSSSPAMIEKRRRSRHWNCGLGAPASFGQVIGDRVAVPAKK